MEMSVILTQMIKFFILMSLGYILYKINIMDSDFNKKLTNLVLKVTMPCMIVSSAIGTGEDRNISKVLSVFVIAIIMYVALPIVGMLIAKLMRFNDEQSGIYVFMTMFGNVGFMGMPLIEVILGKEAVFYAAIFNMIFNICLFTIGVKAINYPDTADNKKGVAEILLHPGVLSAFIAILIYFINIPIHSAVSGAISNLGSVTTPVAMLLMGASLAKVPVKKVFNDWKVYAFDIIKQFALPIIGWIVINMLIKDEYIAMVTLIMLAMPVANTSVMFAIEYDRDEETAAKNVFISTVMSIVSIPVVIYLASII